MVSYRAVNRISESDKPIDRLMKVSCGDEVLTLKYFSTQKRHLAIVSLNAEFGIDELLVTYTRYSKILIFVEVSPSINIKTKREKQKLQKNLKIINYQR